MEQPPRFFALAYRASKNLLFENFEFRHFRPHYLDVDTIFGDLGVNAYQS
jgi:hypothetical protein